MFKTYCCSYRLDGSLWEFEVKAKDFEDARRRVASIAMTGTVDGELMGAIPSHVPAAGVIVRVVVWLRNLLRNR